MHCPCSKQIDYSACCEPYHLGKIPENPLILMKARYSAYALKKLYYIEKTSHPKTFLLEDPLSFKKNIQEFCKITYFEGLYIHAFQEEGKKGYVTFTAKLSQNGIDASFQEKSLFLKEEGIWLYVEGEFSKEKKPVFD